MAAGGFSYPFQLFTVVITSLIGFTGFHSSVAAANWASALGIAIRKGKPILEVE